MAVLGPTRVCRASIVAAAIVGVALSLPTGARATAFPADLPAPVAPECTITGTPGADLLVGTPGDDVICGFGGHDVIRGGGGDDVLLGGAGRDQMAGGPGDDAMSGGRGLDRLVGGQGDDACARDVQAISSSDCIIDADGPVVGDVAIPTTVASGSSISVTWRAVDPSGVGETYLSVSGQQGWASWCFVDSAVMISGDARDGIYSATCEVPANIINDIFDVWVGAYDSFGNVSSSSVTGSFVTTGGSDDLDAPLLSDVTFEPVLRAGDPAIVTFRLQDSTGIGFATAFLRGPATSGLPIIWFYSAPLERISGDERDGVYRVEVPTSSDAALADYDLWLWFGDSVNNRSVIPVGSIRIEAG